MSINANILGGLERPEMTRLTTTSPTVVKTAQAGQVTIDEIGLANETAGAVTIDLHYNDGTTDFLYWSGTVAASSTTLVDAPPLRLYVTDTLKATAGTMNAITVYPATVISDPNEVNYAT